MVSRLMQKGHYGLPEGRRLSQRQAQRQRRGSSRQQKGATLFIAMIFLLIFGAMAAAALSGAISSTRAIGNMQWRNEALAVANVAMNRILGGTVFATDTTFASSINSKTSTTTDRTAVHDLDGDGVADDLWFDVNGDGIRDVRISFPTIEFDNQSITGPTCIRFRPVPLSLLDPTRADDRGCYGTSGAETSGYATMGADGEYGVTLGANSICANTEWVIPLRASDVVTGTNVDVMQGVSVRVFISDASNSCE